MKIDHFAQVLRHPLQSSETVNGKIQAVALAIFFLIPPFCLIHFLIWGWRITHPPQNSTEVSQMACKILFEELNQKINDQLKDYAYEDYTLFNFDVVNRFQSDAVGTRCVKATQVDRGPQAIHANHVAFKKVPSLKLICSQAPLEESTVSFWSSVYQQGAALIDLTTPKDCIAPYYPLLHEPQTITGYKISCTHSFHHGPFTTDAYCLTNTEKDSALCVKRLHFAQWPDFGAVPLNIFKELLDAVDKFESKTLWIHCRAGVGRTGAVAVGLALKKLHAKKMLTRSNYLHTINDLIHEGRTQRDLLFVQSPEQYALLIAYAKSLLKSF